MTEHSPVSVQVESALPDMSQLAEELGASAAQRRCAFGSAT